MAVYSCYNTEAIEIAKINGISSYGRCMCISNAMVIALAAATVMVCSYNSSHSSSYGNGCVATVVATAGAMVMAV